MPVNPFPGLRPFGREQSRYFFGRDAQITDLLQRLKTQRMAGIVGSSGCGKSSVVFAGVLPALDRGFLSGPAHDWQVFDMHPGGRPLSALAVALSQEKGNHEAIEAALRTTTYGLTDWIAQHELDAQRERRVLVFTDQFEELFTFAEIDKSHTAAANRRHFVDILLQAASQDVVPIYWLLTMRTEYLGRCGEYPELADALNRSQYLIPNLSREQLALAITAPLDELDEPVAAAPALVQQLLNDSADERDRLPLLQHCMMRTYSTWAGQTPRPEAIGLGEYREAKEIGGALNEHGAWIYQALPPAQQVLTKRVFRNITRISDDGIAVRRPTLEKDLRDILELPSTGKPDDLTAVLDAFSRPENSFITITRSPDGVEINVSHECLARKWELLRSWIKEEAESVAALRELRRRSERRFAYALLGDLSSFLRRKKADHWNAAWTARYGVGDFESVEAFLRRSVIWNVIGIGVAVAALVTVVVMGVRNEMNTHRLAELNEQVASLSVKLAEKQANEHRIELEISEARRAALDAAKRGNDQEQKVAEEKFLSLSAELERARADLKSTSESYRKALGSTSVYAQQNQNLKNSEDQTSQIAKRLENAPSYDDLARVKALEQQLKDVNDALAATTKTANAEIQKLRDEISELRKQQPGAAAPAPFLQMMTVTQGTVTPLNAPSPPGITIVVDDIKQGATSELFVFAGTAFPSAAKTKDLADRVKAAGACKPGAYLDSGFDVDGRRAWCFIVVKDTVRDHQQMLPPFVAGGRKYVITVAGYVVNPLGDEKLSLVVASQ